jgi:hypothetical protein
LVAAISFAIEYHLTHEAREGHEGFGYLDFNLRDLGRGTPFVPKLAAAQCYGLSRQ